MKYIVSILIPIFLIGCASVSELYTIDPRDVEMMRNDKRVVIISVHTEINKGGTLYRVKYKVKDK